MLKKSRHRSSGVLYHLMSKDNKRKTIVLEDEELGIFLEYLLLERETNVWRSEWLSKNQLQ